MTLAITLTLDATVYNPRQWIRAELTAAVNRACRAVSLFAYCAPETDGQPLPQQPATQHQTTIAQDWLPGQVFRFPFVLEAPAAPSPGRWKVHAILRTVPAHRPDTHDDLYLQRSFTLQPPPEVPCSLLLLREEPQRLYRPGEVVRGRATLRGAQSVRVFRAWLSWEAPFVSPPAPPAWTRADTVYPFALVLPHGPTGRARWSLRAEALAEDGTTYAASQPLHVLTPNGAAPRPLTLVSPEAAYVPGQAVQVRAPDEAEGPLTLSLRCECVGVAGEVRAEFVRVTNIAPGQVVPLEAPRGPHSATAEHFAVSWYARAEGEPHDLAARWEAPVVLAPLPLTSPAPSPAPSWLGTGLLAWLRRRRLWRECLPMLHHDPRGVVGRPFAVTLGLRPSPRLAGVQVVLEAVELFQQQRLGLRRAYSRTLDPSAPRSPLQFALAPEDPPSLVALHYELRWQIVVRLQERGGAEVARVFPVWIYASPTDPGYRG